MKIELLKPINEQYDTIQQLLTNRGIALENIDDYFTEKDYKFNDSEKYNLEISTLFDFDDNFKDDVILV